MYIHYLCSAVFTRRETIHKSGCCTVALDFLEKLAIGTVATVILRQGKMPQIKKRLNKCNKIMKPCGRLFDPAQKYSLIFDNRCLIYLWWNGNPGGDAVQPAGATGGIVLPLVVIEKAK